MTSTTTASSLRINWILPKPGLSGGIKSNRLVAEAMVRRGHQVTLVYPTRKAEEKAYSLGYRCRRWYAQTKQRFLHRGPATPSHHLEKSTANIRAIDADIVTERDVPDADVSIATWWRTREWIEPWSDAKGAKAYFVRGYELWGGDPERVRATYRLPGMKFVIARWLQRLMAEEFGDPNAVLVPNGVDRGQFTAPPREKASEPTVGMLYGQQPIKGADTAFDAIRLLQEKLPSTRVIAFGRDSVIEVHHPPANFEYHLRPAQADIPRLYQRADCWLIPSTTEGFGMPGIEAAACRCPLVATRCGGPEDFVEHGHSGFLVPVGNASEMADAIGRVLSLSPQDWKAMSDASYDISLRFDWDRSAEILESAIEGHLARRCASAS